MPSERSAPAKVILFGEWAVLDGGLALALPLNARLRLQIRDLHEGDEIRFRSDSIDEKKTATLSANGELSDAFFQLAADVLRELRPNLDGCRDREFIFQRDWRLSEGLGSSSAVIATLLKALLPQSEQDQSPLNYWRRGLEILHRRLSPRASGLDLAVQIFDAPVSMRAKTPELWNPPEIPAELQLIHTNDKLSTQDALRKVAPRKDALDEIATSTQNFFDDHDWERAITRHARALEKLGVVPANIREALDDWQTRKWIRSGKTTGAGGGDALLVLVNPLQRRNFDEDLRARGWYFNQSGWAS